MDKAKIVLLLQIAEGSLKWGPLKPLHDVALAELTDMIHDAEAELDKRRKARIAEEQKAAAEVAAKAKADKDAEERAAASARPRAFVPPPAPPVQPRPIMRPEEDETTGTHSDLERRL